MKKSELIKAVLESEELPTLPGVATKLISLTSQEDSTLDDIAALVSQDIALSAKILKVSNSAFYSFPQQIGSITQAVSLLGINAVRSLVLSFSFLTIKRGKKRSVFDFEHFWERSLASAAAAKLILESVKNADTEEVFISGLLQNLGELVVARTLPDEYDNILSHARKNDQDQLQAEQEQLGADHSQIGYEVARAWSFPESLLLAIRHHHDPLSYTGKDKTVQQTLKALYLSDILMGVLYSDAPEVHYARFKKEAKKLLKLKNDTIESILSEVHSQVEYAAEYFNLKIKNPKSVQEILQEANIRLSLINLDYDQMNQQLIQAKISLENLTLELEKKNRILDALANLDGLTGVFNHRYFQNTLDQEISRSYRLESYLTLLFVDIDRFKVFNDTYGHQTGDFVLAEFALTMKSLLRNYDTLARYGGEEFAIILPETNLEEGSIVAEKLRIAISEKKFTDKNENYQVTASFGLSSCRPFIEDGFSKSAFIQQADEALYAAKDQGRNRVVSYAPKKKWFSF